MANNATTTCELPRERESERERKRERERERERESLWQEMSVFK